MEGHTSGPQPIPSHRYQLHDHQREGSDCEELCRVRQRCMAPELWPAVRHPTRLCGTDHSSPKPVLDGSFLTEHEMK